MLLQNLLSHITDLPRTNENTTQANGRFIRQHG